MTLCLAWTQNGSINIASDSRGGHADEYIDTLIKVMDLPVKIETPVDQDGKSEFAYEQTLGFCFSGRTFSSVIIRDHFAETLKHLQFLPGVTELSLENIVKFIAKLFTRVSREFKEGYDWDPETEFLIAGYCPLLNEVAAYNLKLYTGDAPGEFEPSIDRVLADPEEIFYMGSGQDRAIERIEEEDLSTSSEILRVLRDICRDDIPDVGGYMQFGLFDKEDPKNFAIRGVIEYEIDENDEFEYVYTYRGLEMHRGDFEVNEQDLQVRMRYFSPFHKEIKDYFDRKASGD